jgi:hypothetical protein
MRNTELKKAAFVAITTCFLTTSAFGLSAIQLYSPQGTYNAVTDTWVITESNFELWLITAYTDVKPLYDVTLVAALEAGVAPVDGALSIGATTPMAADFDYGTPPTGGAQTLGPHGIYPTHYFELLIGDVLDAPEVVMDMQPGETGTGMGKIFKFQVNSSYDWVHFDAFGYYEDRLKFAPFSHDAQFFVPEPATVVLFSIGLIGGGLVRRRKK